MRKALLLILPAVLLGGCSMFGPKQKSLDEFAVARNAPLVIPAIEALFGGPAPRSQTETSMLESAGRDRAALGIRSTAGDPDTRIVDKGAATQAILAAPPADSDMATAQVPQQ